jgi:carbonic anhydrase
VTQKDKYRLPKVGGKQPLHFKTIDFNYSNDTTLTVKNVNSPNVEGTIRGIPSAGSTLSYDGYVYNLLQFHFHDEAEHTINVTGLDFLYQAI